MKTDFCGCIYPRSDASCIRHMNGLIMNAMNTVRKIISNTVFHIISLLLCGGLLAYAYYLRTVLRYSFLKLYCAGYLGLIISFVIFLIAYKDTEADAKTTVKESLSGYFYFLFFIGITMILRG